MNIMKKQVLARVTTILVTLLMVACPTEPDLTSNLINNSSYTLKISSGYGNSFEPFTLTPGQEYKHENIYGIVDFNYTNNDKVAVSKDQLAKTITFTDKQLLDDSLFDGEFSRYDTSAYGGYQLDIFTFTGTTDAQHYSNYKRWNNSKRDWDTGVSEISFIIEVEDGKYRQKATSTTAKWTNWETYEFSSDGKTLTLNNYNNKSGNNIVLTKN